MWSLSLLYSPFKPLFIEQLVPEHWSHANRWCSFSSESFLTLVKSWFKLGKGSQKDGSNSLADNALENTMEKGYTGIFQAQGDEELSDQTRMFFSGSVVRNGQVPETCVMPELVYVCDDILTDLF